MEKWSWIIRGKPYYFAKLLNRAECSVRIGEKAVMLYWDLLPGQDINCVVSILEGKCWDIPEGEQISEEDFHKIVELLPSLIWKYDRMNAAIEIVKP